MSAGFRDAFFLNFGRTPEHVLQHGYFTFTGRSGEKSLTFDEADKAMSQVPPEARRLVGEDVVDRARKARDQAVATPHKNLVAQALGEWRKGPSRTMFMGEPHMLAARAIALDHEIETNRKANPQPLYRGAGTPPEEELGEGVGKKTLLSFTENKPVAQTFAKVNEGKLFSFSAGQVEGLRMEDYGVTPMNVQTKAGNLSEAEWLISHINNRGQQLR